MSRVADAELPVLNVNTGLSYGKVQEALDADATLNGHTIRVDAGTYYENLVMNKSVSLIGENQFSTIIDGHALGHVVQITADGVNVTGFTIRNSMYGYSGIHVYQSSGTNLSDNIIRGNYNGIYLYGSRDNIVANNSVPSNEYGIHLFGSINTSISGNVALSNKNGIHLDVSSDNFLVDNYVSLSGSNGIYLFESNNNTLLGNRVVSNIGRGIRLHYSRNNTVAENIVSGNAYGIYIYGSHGNILDGNDASFNNESGLLLQDSENNAITDSDISNNDFGIWFVNSSGNGVKGVDFFSNRQYGVRLWNSSSNRFFHNNFANNEARNVEQPTDFSYGNLWDDGFEGNFWHDYDGADADSSGIGDKPYRVDVRTWLGVYSQDSYPLMGPFSQYATNYENQSYIITFVTNSTISGFQYSHSSNDGTGLLRFDVNGTDEGFCRILIPHILIAPAYIVTVNDASLSHHVVATNGTHTWIYFAYAPLEHEMKVTPFVPSGAAIWFQWWFWGIAGLVSAEVVLGAFTVKYRLKIAEQKKLLQAGSPLVIAEALFKTDVERRNMKIKDFEEKYGIKVQPRNNLEDVIGSFRTKEKEEKS